MTHPDFFSLLSDETRLRLAFLLCQAGELCVCDLVGALQTTQPKISRHLALMRRSGLVSDERRGQWVYYRVREGLEPWAKRLLSETAKQLRSVDPYRTDLERLGNQGGCCV